MSNNSGIKFSIKLFQIVITNSYYTLPHDNKDFEIKPTLSSSHWLEQRNMRLLYHTDGIALAWCTQCYDDPLTLLQKKIEGVTLSFIILLQNSQLLNVSVLESTYAKNQCYHLHNRHKHNYGSLHSNSELSHRDLVQIDTLKQDLPGQHIFGIVDIDLSYWLNNLPKALNIASAALTTYYIKIKNRSTIWRYHLIDTTKRLNGTLKIVCQGNPSYFGEVKGSTQWPGSYYAESTEPMAFYDRYDRIFSLYKWDKGEEKQTTALREHLPYPNTNALKRDGKDKKKLYSDIVVYV